MPELRVVRSELILGAEPGGKTQRADALARAWIGSASGRRAVYIDTAQSWDEEMRRMIARVRQPGTPAARTAVAVEEPVELAHALGAHSRPDTLIVVDCLTFWLTATLMQAMEPEPREPGAGTVRGAEGLAGARPPLRMVDAVRACAGPLVLVSSRIALGPHPPTADFATLVGTLDVLDRQAVAACERVTLMSAGVPLTLKDPG